MALDDPTPAASNGPERLRRARLARGLSQQRLADAAHVSVRTMDGRAVMAVLDPVAGWHGLGWEW